MKVRVKEGYVSKGYVGSGEGMRRYTYRSGRNGGGRIGITTSSFAS
jgi:hypothetical protein